MRSTHLAALIIAVVGCGAGLAKDDPPAKRPIQDFLQVAADGYLDNRDGIEFFTCRFRVTKATARSEEKALSGEWVDPLTSDVTWIVDGKKELHNETADPRIFEEASRKAVKGKSGMLETSVPLVSRAQLADSKNGLNYSPQLNAVNLYSLSDGPKGLALTPVSMGVMGVDDKRNPGQLLRDCKEGRRQCLSQKKEVIDERPVLTFVVGDTPEKRTHQYSLDLDRGFSPIRIILFGPKGETVVKIAVTNLRKCSKGRWFPDRSIAVSYPREANEPFSVTEIKVLEFDAEKRPDASVFKLKFPAKTAIIRPPNMLAWFELDKEQEVTLGDIPGLMQKCEEVKNRKEAARKPKELLASSMSSDSWQLTLFVGVVILLTVTATIWWFRRIARWSAASTTKTGTTAGSESPA